MSRLIPEGSIVLTPADARILYQAAKIGELRSRYRIGDTKTYELLTEISIVAFHAPASTGNLERQETASEESDYWTVQRTARASGLSIRTVRLDCQRGDVPASKQGNSWLIPAHEARTYIQRRRRR